MFKNRKKDYVLYELIDTELTKKKKGDTIYVINPSLVNNIDYKGIELTVTSNNSYLYAISEKGEKYKFNSVGNDMLNTEEGKILKAYSSLQFFDKMCNFDYIRYMLIQNISRANTEEDYDILKTCFEYHVSGNLKEKVKEIIK